MDQKKRKLEDGDVPSGGGMTMAVVPAFEVTKEDVKKLVEPFSKEQLMDLLEDAALVHSGWFLLRAGGDPQAGGQGSRASEDLRAGAGVGHDDGDAEDGVLAVRGGGGGGGDHGQGNGEEQGVRVRDVQAHGRCAAVAEGTEQADRRADDGVSAGVDGGAADEPEPGGVAEEDLRWQRAAGPIGGQGAGRVRWVRGDRGRAAGVRQVHGAVAGVRPDHLQDGGGGEEGAGGADQGDRRDPDVLQAGGGEREAAREARGRREERGRVVSGQAGGIERSSGGERAELGIRVDEHGADNDGNTSEPGREPRNEPGAAHGAEQPQPRAERAERVAEWVAVSGECVAVFAGAVVERVDERVDECRPEPAEFGGDGVVRVAAGHDAVRRSGGRAGRAAGLHDVERGCIRTSSELSGVATAGSAAGRWRALRVWIVPERSASSIVGSSRSVGGEHVHGVELQSVRVCGVWLWLFMVWWPGEFGRQKLDAAGAGSL